MARHYNDYYCCTSNKARECKVGISIWWGVLAFAAVVMKSSLGSRESDGSIRRRRTARDSSPMTVLRPGQLLNQYAVPRNKAPATLGRPNTATRSVVSPASVPPRTPRCHIHHRRYPACQASNRRSCLLRAWALNGTALHPAQRQPSRSHLTAYTSPSTGCTGLQPPLHFLFHPAPWWRLQSYWKTPQARRCWNPTWP